MTSVVYFIENDAGAIKIGSTSSLAARFTALQTASACLLTVLGVIDGDYEVERQIQNAFRHLSIQGEWFRAEPDLRDWISNHARPAVLSEVTRIRSPSAVADEAVELIGLICCDEKWPLMVKQLLGKVSETTGISERRLRGMWNREAGIIRAEEMDCLRENARRAAPHRFLTREQHEDLLRRLAFLEDRMAQIDPSFSRPLADAGCAGQRVAGRAARPLVGGR